MNRFILILSVALATLSVNVSAQSYEYDAAGRLVKVLYDNGKGVVYTYDTQDNLIQVTPIVIPRAVENLKMSPLSVGKAVLSWEHSGDVLLFLIQTKPVGTDNWTNGASIDDVNARTATIDLPFGQDLLYRIVVFGNGDLGQSAPSVEVELPSQVPIMVTTLDDENDHALGRGAGDSLREAIEAADPGEVINFSPELLSQIYTPLAIGQTPGNTPTVFLSGTQLVIDKNLTIDASALPNSIRIDANGNSRVFSVSTAETVLLKGLTMSGGDSSMGGALINSGVELTLEECSVVDNISSDFGGGLYNGNGGILVLDETTIAGNIANFGGGVYNASDSSLETTFSTFSQNSATDGGGIYNAGPDLIVDRSALSANDSTHNGGAIFNTGVNVLVENSTLAGNASADNTGGAISNNTSGDLIIRHSTIAANTGTGIINDAPAVLTLDNSIVANNFNLLNVPIDILGDFTSVAANLIREHTGTLLGGPAPITNDPVLGPLGSYGGRSHSMPPLVGSPVLDAGVVTVNTPSTDQDSSFRPNGDAPELGAIESRLSSETNLEWVTTSAGSLSPVFRSSLTSYTASVPNEMATVAFRSSKLQFGQNVEVRINGGDFSEVESKAASGELPLVAGENDVEIRVTAQNGNSTKTYEITVTRGAPSASSTDLASLSASVGSLSPSFDPETIAYHSVVSQGTTSTTVTATTASADATMLVRSNFGSYLALESGVASPPLELKTGVNAIDIKVTAKDGATTTVHSVTVTREPPAISNPLLASLTASVGDLSPAFNRGLSVYNVEVSGNIGSTTVSATMVESSASIQISLNGGAFSPLASGVQSAELALAAGENIIEVKGIPEDGSTSSSYALIVTRVIETLDWISEFGDASSTKPSMSSDCRYIVFASSADNLIAEAVNNNEHIYLYDRFADTMRLLSVSEGGEQGDRNSSDPVISADGKFVAFQSEARNLVPSDTNGDTDPSSGRDIFVYDVTLDTIERVSLRDNGGESNQASGEPSISGDGRYVAFQSSANNLVSGYAVGNTNVYVHDRTENTIVGISVPFADILTNRDSLSPAISTDGTYVAFEFSVDRNDDDQDLNYRYTDIYLYNTGSKAIERITGTKIGTDADGTKSEEPSISADGRYVAFESNLEDIDFYDTNKAVDIFVYDRVEGTTRRVSANGSTGGQDFRDSTNPSLSGDGRKVAFESMASNLVDSDTNNAIDIFMTDLATGEISLVSVNSEGVQGDGYSYLPALSHDGKCMVFQSAATNMVSGDGGSFDDIFVKEIEAIAPSSLASLASLTTNLGAVAATENTYSAIVSENLGSVQLRPIVAEAGAAIQASVNSGAFVSLLSDAVSTFALTPGANVIEIKVTAADGIATKTYILSVDRSADVPSLFSNANLSALTTSNGSLIPLFNSDTLLYSTVVENSTSSIALSPILADLNATVTINGSTVDSGSASDLVGLSVGSNTIIATVTAVDGVTNKTYAVAVTRLSDGSINVQDIQQVSGSPAILQVTWVSIFDGVYVIEKSTDLKVWQVLEGEIPSQGSLTTFDVELDESSNEKVFLRVRIK